MKNLAQIIQKMIDFCYQPFKKFLPIEVFRYGVCGGSNLVFDWVLYFLCYNFLIGHDLVRITLLQGQELCITPHIASLCVVFPITLLSGFWLNKYVTFTQSTLRGWNQLGRYMMIVGINLGINYFGLKLLVDVLEWYPTPSKMLITIVTVFFSFFGQKYFSFRRNG